MTTETQTASASETAALAANQLSVTSYSLQIDWPNIGTPTVPQVQLGTTQITPATPPTSPVGIQAAVLDPQANNAVVLNKYYALQQVQIWSTVYESMWDAFAADVRAAQEPGRILIVATFGLDADMPPTDQALEAVGAAGGNGAAVTNWLATCDPGSMAGRTDGWISYPTSYALVGAFGEQPGDGLELVSRTGVRYWLENPPYPINQIQATLAL